MENGAKAIWDVQSDPDDVQGAVPLTGDIMNGGDPACRGFRRVAPGP